MATRSIVPRADSQGGIGTALKRWASGFFVTLSVGGINPIVKDGDMVGTKNGINLTFTFPSSDTPQKAYIFLNGTKLREGTGFTRVGGTVTITNDPIYIPQSTDTLETIYWV